MTFDDDLVAAVDRVAKQLQTSRSAFTRAALRETIAKFTIEQLELKHQKGYKQQPAAAEEVSVWETEQSWGDK